MRRLSSALFGLAGLGLSVSVAACKDSAGAVRAENDIVDVPQSGLKNQSISNCWLYATVGWAESLHAATGQPPLDLSESYLSYWHWFDHVFFDGAPSDKIDDTGYFRQGMDLIWRFGVIAEGDFIAEEAGKTTSNRQSTAKTKMDASLRSGALKTPEARRDAALVRRELDAAWGLSPDIVAKMNGVFGAGYDMSLDDPEARIPAGTPIKRAAEIPVKLVTGTEGEPAARAATLADAVGDRAGEGMWEGRRGPLAWNEYDYPTSPAEQRTFEKRIQRALHAQQPVVISWFIDFAAMNERGEFRGPPARPGRQGGHVTILEDYEIENVPGFGTLKAGVNETRPEALTAALADEAKVVFLRSKNSWGSGAGPVPAFSGYLDLYAAYLNGPVTRCDRAPGAAEPTCVADHTPLWRVGLPAGF